MQISYNLKEIRRKLNMSVDDLAKAVGVPARTLGGYERNERTPSIELASQLCKKLNVNVNWFLTGEGSMFIQPDIQDENSLSIKLKKGQTLKVEYEE